jgi:hypothetical protein
MISVEALLLLLAFWLACAAILGAGFYDLGPKDE